MGDALSDLRLVLSSETFGQQVVEDGGEGVREEFVELEVLFLDQFGELGFEGPLGKFDQRIEIGWALLALSGQDCRRDASGDLECFGAVLRVFQKLFADPAGQFDRDVQAGLWVGVFQEFFFSLEESFPGEGRERLGVGECQCEPLGGLAAGSLGALEDCRCEVLIGRIEKGLNGIWVELGVE